MARIEGSIQSSHEVGIGLEASQISKLKQELYQRTDLSSYVLFHRYAGILFVGFDC